MVSIERRKIFLGVESIYGSIIVALLLSSFIGLYMIMLDNQQINYNEIMSSLNIENKRSSERVTASINGDKLYLSSNIESKIIMILARNYSETYYIDLSKNPIIVRPDSLTYISEDLLQWMFNMRSKGFNIFMMTGYGNIIPLNDEIDLLTRSSDNQISACFPYDFAFNATKDVYYIIYGTWTAFVRQNTSIGSIYSLIPTYSWDINTSYTIFQSPINGTIYLRRSVGALPLLETKKWFKPPTIMYAPDPTDLRVVIRLLVDNPYGDGSWQTIYWGSGNTVITYLYNGSVLVQTNASWSYPYGAIYDSRVNNPVSPGYYRFFINITNYVALQLYLEMHVYVRSNDATGFYNDKAWTGYTGDQYRPYLISPVSYPNGNFLNSISDINIFRNWSFIINQGSPSQQPSPQYNGLYLFIGVSGYLGKTYTLNILNISRYSPDINGFIKADNGYLIYDLTPLFYYGWRYS